MEKTLGSLLVVDDNEMNRDLLSRSLERHGYTVTVVAGGADAISSLEQVAFDAVLLDIMMPDISGWDVLKWIRERFSREQLPVIMATAKDSRTDVVLALQCGANDYVTKPLDLKVLLARVNVHVILERTMQSLKQANQQLKISNDQIQSDLTIAAEVQQSRLPSKSLKFHGCNVAWEYRPCDKLAGDFLDIFAFNERYLGCYLFDVSGHGAPAALMSSAVSQTLKPILNETCLTSQINKSHASSSHDGLMINSPSQVAESLNEIFPFDPKIGKYFTLIYGVFDRSLNQLRFTSAGHPPPVILYSSGKIELAKISPGFPIGLIPKNNSRYEQYTEVVLTLNPGDRVIFYSDGVLEAMDTQGNTFGQQRMLASLAANAHRSLDESTDSLLAEVLDWSAPRSPGDDISILALEVH